MKLLKPSLALSAALTMFSAVAVAQPSIGLHFDFGSQELVNYTTVRVDQVGIAYVVTTDADMVINGASFKLTDPGNLVILEEYFPLGVHIGDMFNGVDIGMADTIYQYADRVAILAWFKFYSTSPLTQNISVVAHPNYDTPLLAFPNGMLVEAQGLTGYIDVQSNQVASEETTWSHMKALYK